MPKAIDVAFETRVARAMLAELEEYLKSDVAFWQAGPNALGDRMPKLTIGGLLEALLRAEAGGAVDAPQVRSMLEAVKARRIDRYLMHAEQETRGRLDAWSGYLNDYDRNPEEAASYYANEVRSRLKAELLLGELEPRARGRAEHARAAALDARVRSSFTPGVFVWDERLKPFLPSERFWWLYGRLRG